MLKNIQSLSEAKQFFDNYTGINCYCVNGNSGSKICQNYKEAENYYIKK